MTSEAYHYKTSKRNFVHYPQVVPEVKFVINFVFWVEATVLLLPHVFPEHLVCLKDFLTTQTLQAGTKTNLQESTPKQNKFVTYFLA